VPVGAPTYWGGIVVANSGDEPLELRSARVLSARGLKVRRVLVAGPRRSYGNWGLFPVDKVREDRDQFKSSQWTEIAGFELPPRAQLKGMPHANAQIVFEFEGVERGRHDVKGAEISYESGGDTETFRVEDQAVVCAPLGCDAALPN